MTKLFWVYEYDEDDEGCVRLHVNTNVPYSLEACEELSRTIDSFGIERENENE